VAGPTTRDSMTVEQYRAAQAVAMTERDLQKEVRKLALDAGWETFTWWTSLNSPAGWPDLVLVRESPGFARPRTAAMVFVELKKEKGFLTPPQVRVHRLLALTGHAVYVWRPSDLLAGKIAEALA